MRLYFTYHHIGSSCNWWEEGRGFGQQLKHEAVIVLVQDIRRSGDNGD